MRKRATLFLICALALPGAALAQSADPSPMLVGFGSQEVCLSITGPVVLLTPETLTEGIANGTFTIDAITDCEMLGASPEASIAPSMAPEPASSPAA